MYTSGVYVLLVAPHLHVYRSTAADRLHTLSTQHKKRATLTDTPSDRTGPLSVSPLLESRGAADSLRQPRRLSYPTFLGASSAINVPNHVRASVLLRSETSLSSSFVRLFASLSTIALSFSRVDGAVVAFVPPTASYLTNFLPCIYIYMYESRRGSIPGRLKIEGTLFIASQSDV